MGGVRTLVQCLVLGGVSVHVVVGERKRDVEADPDYCGFTLLLISFWPWPFHLCTLVLLAFLDGLYPRLIPSLVMLVGGIVCLPGAVLESVVSGVLPWVVSDCECCVLLAVGGA